MFSFKALDICRSGHSHLVNLPTFSSGCNIFQINPIFPRRTHKILISHEPTPESAPTITVVELITFMLRCHQFGFHHAASSRHPTEAATTAHTGSCNNVSPKGPYVCMRKQAPANRMCHLHNAGRNRNRRHSARNYSPHNNGTNSNQARGSSGGRLAAVSLNGSEYVC